MIHSHTAAAAIPPAVFPSEAFMAVSFSRVPANNPAIKGSLAARKQLFGEHFRYAVAPVHTRFDAVEWFVWDAEHALSTMGRAEVIRQAATLEEAMEGLQ